MVQRQVIFYWHPNNRIWSVYEDDQDPIGQYSYNDSYLPFDWQRWMDDAAYFNYFQQSLGIPLDDQQPAPVVPPTVNPPVAANPAPVNAQPLVTYTAAQAIENGHREIRALVGTQQIGRARFSQAPTDIPGGGGQQGIELSEVFVEPNARGHGTGDELLRRFFRTVGYSQRVWLDAQSHGGLDQNQLQNWYGRKGFKETNHGKIMATVDFM